MKATKKIRLCYLIMALMLMVTNLLVPQIPPEDLASKKAYEVDRTAWLKGQWGVMTHYLLAWQSREYNLPETAEQWNKMVDAFDVEGLAEQIASTGATYHLLTIGQGTTHLLTPSPTFDSLFVVGPSNCARRDLIADMVEALAKRGIKLMVYTTCGPPRGAKRIGSTEGNPEGDYRNKERMLAWESVIREWSQRWGDKVVGWWLDGGYTPNQTFRYQDAPNYQSLAAACRAGNPMAAVTFNRGVMDRPISNTPYEDYTGGEINDIETARLWRIDKEGKVDGARMHLLSYLGQKWGIGEPRYEDLNEIVISRTIGAIEMGGFVTWDVPVQPSGLIPEKFLDQLRAIGKAVKERPQEDLETLRAERIAATKAQLKEISSAIEALKSDIGHYPTTEEGLDILVDKSAGLKIKKWKGPYLKEIPRDIFLMPFKYVYPSKRGKAYDLLSSGPDREFGTGDDIYFASSN